MIMIVDDNDDDDDSPIEVKLFFELNQLGAENIKRVKRLPRKYQDGKKAPKNIILSNNQVRLMKYNCQLIASMMTIQLMIVPPCVCCSCSFGCTLLAVR